MQMLRLIAYKQKSREKSNRTTGTLKRKKKKKKKEGGREEGKDSEEKNRIFCSKYDKDKHYAKDKQIK